MYKKFYSSHWFLKKKSNIFTFSHSKNETKHAEICREGNLGPDFQQVQLVFFFFFFVFFLKFSQYCCETSKIQIQQRKVKIFS